MRARDSIAGEIGEYFAISRFNKLYSKLPLIRLRNSHRDIDAIQLKTGKSFAVKTLSKYPGNTSSIWSKDIQSAVDYFLIVHLDPFSLEPLFIIKAGAAMVSKYALKKVPIKKVTKSLFQMNF